MVNKYRDEIIKTEKGEKEILEYFDSQQFTNVKLEWKPDFVDVSSSGDMAYTFGKYTFSATSEKGEPIEAKSIFHTVWKRQSDNNWKYVWD